MFPATQACSCFALLCLLAPLAARADFETVGFSKDDAYVAFVEHGTSQGKGAPWARLTILDVARSAKVGKPVEVELDPSGDKSTEEAAVMQAKESAQAELSRLGITEAARASKVDAQNEFGGEGWEVGIVQVETRPAPQAPKKGRGARCAEPFKPLLLRVSMSQPDAEPVTLLNEKTLSKEHPCVGECAPQAVFAHGKAALVIARCTAPGFEGTGEKIIAIAARLPWSLLSAP